MASYPSLPIRRLVVHSYPGVIKAADAKRMTVFTGRRGRPVKKPRFVPADLVHQLARRLQAGGSALSRGLRLPGNFQAALVAGWKGRRDSTR
jgi:hypothetical protein